MLPKKHRLKTKSDFDRIYKNGRKTYAKDFMIITAKRSQQDLPDVFKLPRFGFVASKKVGKAVHRNKAKRLLREAVNAELNALSMNFEAVIIAFNSLPQKSQEEINPQIKQLFEKLNLYRKESQEN